MPGLFFPRVLARSNTLRPPGQDTLIGSSTVLTILPEVLESRPPPLDAKVILQRRIAISGGKKVEELATIFNNVGLSWLPPLPAVYHWSCSGSPASST